MDIKKYLLEDSIMVDVETSSKKNVLELISQKLSKITTSNEDEIFEKLYEREKLGTTAFGKGIAIPHARIDGIFREKMRQAKNESEIESLIHNYQ